MWSISILPPCEFLALNFEYNRYQRHIFSQKLYCESSVPRFDHTKWQYVWWCVFVVTCNLWLKCIAIPYSTLYSSMLIPKTDQYRKQQTQTSVPPNWWCQPGKNASFEQRSRVPQASKTLLKCMLIALTHTWPECLSEERRGEGTPLKIDEIWLLALPCH